MSLIDQINADFKSAMLAHDDFAKVTLSSLKSAIKYKEVENGSRSEGLDDADIQAVIAHECKTRADSATAYQAAGNQELADKELRERELMQKYLPSQLTADELAVVVHEVLAAGEYDQKSMGRAIGTVKARVGVSAEGGAIAAAVKEALK